MTLANACTVPVLVLFLVRELAKRLENTPLITNAVNPGYCVSALRRNLPSGPQRAARIAEILVGRSTEAGSRIIVWAAVGNSGRDEDELRGAYINLCKIAEPSDFVLSKTGNEVQKRLWVRVIALYVRALRMTTDLVLQDESIEVLSSVSPAFKEIVSSF